jgi:hypothetical protein
MFMQELPFDAAHPGERRVRTVTSTLLRTASRALDGLATRLSLAARPPRAEPLLEFHAEAGAPEGALFVNGELVGRVLGVNRL